MKDELTIINTTCRVRESSPDDLLQVGKWYWVTGEECEWLECAVHVGTNYVEFEGVEPRYTTRVHLDEFHEICQREVDPENYINGRVAHYRMRSRQLLGEIADLTARLCVSPRASLQGRPRRVGAGRLRRRQAVGKANLRLAQRGKTSDDDQG